MITSRGSIDVYVCTLLSAREGTKVNPKSIKARLKVFPFSRAYSFTTHV
ncbi:MAG: hypothetical protein AB1611_12635 [bacterium]